MEQSNYFICNREKWLIQRKGRFTSSDAWKLFQCGRREMTEEELAARPRNEKGTLLDRRTTVDVMFGETALTLIRSKIAEITSTEVEREINGGALVKSLEWGVTYESDAVDEFKRRTKLNVIYHGLNNPVFYSHGDYAGGSPDGDVIEENAGLEIKCPVDETVHIKRLLVRSVEQFKEDDFEGYCQCQANMYIMKKDWWYFASYDPRKKDERLRMKIIKLFPDTDWQAEYEARITAAVEIMADVLFDTDKYLFIDK